MWRWFVSFLFYGHLGVPWWDPNLSVCSCPLLVNNTISSWFWLNDNSFHLQHNKAVTSQGWRVWRQSLAPVLPPPPKKQPLEVPLIRCKLAGKEETRSSLRPLDYSRGDPGVSDWLTCDCHVRSTRGLIWRVHFSSLVSCWPTSLLSYWAGIRREQYWMKYTYSTRT
jgi:hypothetical protein